MKASLTSGEINRRVFMGRAGTAAVGLALVPLASCDSTGFAPIGEGADLPFLTPTDRLFTQFGGEGALDDWPGAQQIDNAAWTLRIEGRVDRPLTLRYGDVLAEPATAVLATMRCILDNNDVPGLVGTCTWTGVPLSVFLDRAGLDPTAVRLRFFGTDGFTDNLPVGRIYSPEAGLPEPLLAFGMGTAPLPAAHGGPVRLVVPGHYGHKSVKWIERIEATENDEAFGTYQQIRGYADDGRVRVTSKLTSHLRGATLPPGATRLSGFAYGGAEPVARIEIAVDGGAFEDARIVPIEEIAAREPELAGALQAQQAHRYPYAGVWTLWEYRWDATPGDHSFRIRATAESGATQPETDDDPTDGENPILEFGVRVEV